MTNSLRDQWQNAPQAALAQLQQSEDYAGYSWYVRAQVALRAEKLCATYAAHVKRAKPLIECGRVDEKELLALMYPSRLSDKDPASRGTIKDEALRELREMARFSVYHEASETAHLVRMRSLIEARIAGIHAKTPNADVSVFTDSLGRIQSDYAATFSPPPARLDQPAAAPFPG